MKVLLINGSPKEHGCTDLALSEVARTLRENGIETEQVWIGTKPVRGCIACGGCSGKGRCVFGDDPVNTVLEKMAQAGGLVVGSPVYYASANGSVVSLLDRMFYAGAGSLFAGKPAAAVVSARRAGTTASIDELNKYFTISGMPVVSSSYWNMIHGNNPQEAAQDAEGLQVMRNLGRNMAWLLHCIEAGKEKGIAFPAQENSCRTNFIR